MNVIARSLVFPVMAVASGLLYVVDNIEEYVSTGPSMQETERHIQKVTDVASGKVSSPATSPVRKQKANAIGSPVHAL